MSKQDHANLSSPAAINTPLFRFCLTVALAWIIGGVFYFVVGDWFTNEVRESANQRIDAQCLWADRPAICKAVVWATKSDWEMFWYGGPHWIAAKYLIIPPTLLLLLAAFGRRLFEVVNRYGSKWSNWVRFGSQTDNGV